MNIPPPSRTLIAVDIGTGSTRALLVNQDLVIQSVHAEPNRLIEPHSGWVEQNPGEVFNTTVRVIQQAASHAKSSGWNVAGLCFSSTASSLLAVDSNNNPLGNALTWADNRAREQALKLSEFATALYQQSGTPLHASYWLPKLCWIKENQPESFKKAYHWMGLKDYVIWRLTGEYITDFCTAAATGMLDLHNLQWSEFACTLANISSEQFPTIQPTTFTIPYLQTEISELLGLPSKTAIILGAGDGPLANLGSGVIHPSQAASTIGSSGACRSIAHSPVLQDNQMRIWSYPLLKDVWVIGGAENSGGLVVDWFLNNFTPPADDRFAAMIQSAGQMPAGGNGLIFLPYLFGERAPIWDARARGTFIGLENSHSMPHMARAVLEGTIFALYDVYRVLCQYTATITEIRVSGGYTRAPFWLGIQASMFGKELTVLENHECTALGAAILGFFALGVYPDLQSGVSLIKVKEIIQPVPEEIGQYQELIPLYQLVYQQLKPVFEGLENYRSPHP